MDLAEELRQFTGSEQFYRHGLVRNVIYTEGVRHLVESANAYWLLDKVATLQLDPRVRAQEFQVWKLEVDGAKAVLTCEDGDDHVVHSENIEFTDFPLPVIALYFRDNTVMLPSEY